MIPPGRVALSLYLLQLVFNVLWSWLFFGWHLGGGALVDVIGLWGLILATLVAFWRIDRLAAQSPAAVRALVLLAEVSR